jgi:copper chaperone CopZ
MKNYTFHVSGTHCASCKILIEDILNDQKGIKNAHVDLKNKLVTVDTDSGASLGLCFR